MPRTLAPGRLLRLLAAAAALAGLAACNDVAAPADDHGHADEIFAMRLTVAGPAGPATYRLTDGGVLAPSPLRLPLGATAVTVAFLGENDDELDDIPADEYEIQFGGLPAGVAFARTGAFAGVFTATGSGTGTMQIQLLHLEEGHADLGPFFLPVTLGG
jgi:hypothetical protein